MLAAIIIPLVLAALHWLLFPLISLSTGELKPRSTFFEHKDLIPHSASTSYLNLEANDIRSVESVPSVCGHFESFGLPCLLQGSTMAWSYATPYFIDDAEDIIVVVVELEFESAKSTSETMHRAASFLHQLRGGRWLAKTVVFLVPCEGESSSSDAVQAWLHLFLTGAAVGNHKPVRMLPLSGSIRAAISLKLSGLSGDGHARTQRFDVNLGVVGEAGRLPNADLVNLASHAFHGVSNVQLEHAKSPDANARYWARLQALLDFCQALLRSSSHEEGEATTHHSVFLNAGIDALTVEATSPSVSGRGASEEDVIRGIETMLRGLNRCEQKLSHGFYLYALMGPNFFVSIGEWGITLVLMTIPFVVFGLPLFSRIKCVLPSWAAVYFHVLVLVAGTELIPSKQGRLLLSLGALVIPDLFSFRLFDPPCPAARSFHLLVAVCCTALALGAQNAATSVFGISAALGLLAVYVALNSSRLPTRAASIALLVGAAATAPGDLSFYLAVLVCCFSPLLSGGDQAEKRRKS